MIKKENGVDINKVCIITPYHMEPPSPRILREADALKEIGLEVNILYPPRGLNIHKRNIYIRNEFTKLINRYDKFIVYDLLTLFYLSLVIKKYNIKTKTIYEVIDDFPHYYSYKVLKRLIGKNILAFFLEKTEAFLIKHFTSFVLVNSSYLYNRLSKYTSNIDTLFYTSPFEGKDFFNNPDYPPAFVYIGAFTPEKGSNEIINLAITHPNIPFYVIGSSSPCNIKPKNLTIYPRYPIDKLFSILKKISKKYFIFGLSLIQNLNKSYAVQEANKDIDYLALGIPIVGNKRRTTYEKIQLGAGLLIDNLSIDMLFLRDIKLRLSAKAKEIYNLHYSYNRFKKVLSYAISCK